MSFAMLVPTIGPIIRQRSASQCNGAGYAVDVGVNKAMEHLAAFQKSCVGNWPTKYFDPTIANRKESGHPELRRLEAI
ncbi:hypothetical protein ABIE85_000907 [Bradyrhizobium diazoefficiens]|uniref:hypothetical protein n=1 Tax=Bradyrhizobium TaxID=374 RepID=UPI00272CFF0F|nr:hypothetical protein [Bradyrhizobium diazoefficiens]WLA59970.1 hypothetical protein QIH81_15280 [Bradyrhizobium diazoefficiens]